MSCGDYGRICATRLSERDLVQTVVDGAALWVRPIAMTVAVIVEGLLPIMWGSMLRRRCGAESG